jgi:flagellar protein FliS
MAKAPQPRRYGAIAKALRRNSQGAAAQWLRRKQRHGQGETAKLQRRRAAQPRLPRRRWASNKLKLQLGGIMATAEKSYQQYLENTVASAKPEDLTLMLYNGLAKFIARAQEEIRAADLEAAHNTLLRCQDIVFEFQFTLDAKYEVANSLMLMYDYLYNRLIEANAKKDTEILDEVHSFVTELRDTWIDAVKLNRERRAPAAAVGEGAPAAAAAAEGGAASAGSAGVAGQGGTAAGGAAGAAAVPPAGEGAATVAAAAASAAAAAAAAGRKAIYTKPPSIQPMPRGQAGAPAFAAQQGAERAVAAQPAAGQAAMAQPAVAAQPAAGQVAMAQPAVAVQPTAGQAAAAQAWQGARAAGQQASAGQAARVAGQQAGQASAGQAGHGAWAAGQQAAAAHAGQGAWAAAQQPGHAAGQHAIHPIPPGRQYQAAPPQAVPQQPPLPQQPLSAAGGANIAAKVFGDPFNKANPSVAAQYAKVSRAKGSPQESISIASK